MFLFASSSCFRGCANYTWQVKTVIPPQRGMTEDEEGEYIGFGIYGYVYMLDDARAYKTEQY